MKYFVIAFLILFVGILAWNSRYITYSELAALAASDEGLDSATARKFFHDSLIDACHDAAMRVKITELSESDCELAVQRKTIFCDMNYQFVMDKTIRSEEDFESYAKSYVECLYPDNTKYVDERTFSIYRDFKK